MIQGKNRYRAPIAVIAICAIIMVCLSFVKPPLEDSQNSNAFIGLNEAKHEQLPMVGSFDNLKKILAVNYDKNLYRIESWDSSVENIKGTQSTLIGDEGSLKSESSASANYSSTNVQVQGVDEGNMYKTDGKYIFKINMSKIVIASAYPAERMKVVSEIPVGKYRPMEMFLNGKYMVIIANCVGVFQTKSKKVGDYYEPMENVKAIIFDVSNKSKPKQVREIDLEGRYISSRIVNSMLYVTANKRIPIYDKGRDIDEKGCLPHYRDSFGKSEEKAIDYSNIKYCPEAIDPNYIIAVSLDLKKIDKEVKITTILGPAGNMYVSDKNLYVTGAKYDKGKVETSIYKFELQNGNVEFIAKGNVPGYMLNQFFMGEKGKCFRITTTDNTGMLKGGNGERKNNLYVLDENLKIKGKLEGIAPGKKISATRFIGDRAYVVTYENTDPLFVIDLKNPENPKVVGELKITGFSNYLHLYDENHIISVAIENGIKLVIFDVSDVSNPKQQFVTTIRGSSDMLYNHKSLLFNKDKNLLAFPVEVTQEHEGDKPTRCEFQGLYVYNVDLKDGFVLRDKIIHDDLDSNYIENQVTDGIYKVQRGLYINDVLYTLSYGGIKANNLNDLREIGKIKINH